MEAELIGHRGYREWVPGLAPAEQIPENSIEAFKKSFIPKGLDGVELDVHLSRDNKLVVFHDDDLNELTNVNDLLQPHDPATGPDPLLNVNGVDLTRLRALQANDPKNETNDPQNGKIYIADLDLNEIQALRLKTHPDPDGVRYTVELHAIPTLAQVFQAVDTARATDPDRRFKITIEVKEASMVERRADLTFVPDANGEPRKIKKDIAGAVTGTISDFLQGPKQAPWSKADNLVVSSFHKMTLGRLRHADPDIPRSALYSKFEQRDFRVSDGYLEMKDRGAENWTALRPAVPTDHLFSDFNTNETQNERVWDMTEKELKEAIDADSKLPIVGINDTQLTDRANQPLVGVMPQNVSISISEMTAGVVETIRSTGAEVSVWTANEPPIDQRLSQDRSDLFDFLQAQGVTSFITDNSDKMVRERNTWRERRQAAELSQQQTATPVTEPALAQGTGPSVEDQPSGPSPSAPPPQPESATLAQATGPSVQDQPSGPPPSAEPPQPESATLVQATGPSVQDPPSQQLPSAPPPQPEPATLAETTGASVQDPPSQQPPSAPPPQPEPATLAQATGPSVQDPPSQQLPSAPPPQPESVTPAQATGPSVGDQPLRRSSRTPATPPELRIESTPRAPTRLQPPPQTSLAPAPQSRATGSHPGPGQQPQRRLVIPVVPEGLPENARPFNNDGSTPGRVYFDAMGSNAAAQFTAMLVGYALYLSPVQAFVSKQIPNGGSTIGMMILLAAVQGMVQATFLAPMEEAAFGLAAEGGAASLGGAVVARSNPYPEFKLPPSPGAFPEEQGAHREWHEAVRAHNTALNYARTHGGIEPTYEAQHHQFSKLVLHPVDPDAEDYLADLARYKGQGELRQEAEDVLRNRPIELSDYPSAEYDLAPRHVRVEQRQWLEQRHNAEVAYANDLAGRTEYASLNIESIPARGAEVASYDNHVRDMRNFLEQRSHKLEVSRKTFTSDQQSADYGSRKIDSVLIAAFAILAGLSAATLPKGLLQSAPGTALAGAVFGAINNYQRLQNRHHPSALTEAPEVHQATDSIASTEAPDVRQATDNIALTEVGGARVAPDAGIPTHYVLEGRGLQHGWEAFKEIWNGISDSGRLSDGVLGARNTWEKARNHAQQLLSYLIGSSYGLVSYNVVRTGVDHLLGGSEGRWQSFLRETAATAAFVSCGDLSILHSSVTGRRGVTGVSPAYAASNEAYQDLRKTLAGREVFSTVNRSRLSTRLDQAYNVVQKGLRLSQHALMDTVNLAATPLISSATKEQRVADTREMFGQNAGTPTVYGTLPYVPTAKEQRDRTAHEAATRSLSGQSLEIVKARADNLWPAEQRLHELWRDIEPTLPRPAATQQPAGAPVQEVAPPQPSVEALLQGWQPSAELLRRCEAVVRDLQEARGAVNTLIKAEINIERAVSEMGIEVEYTSIVHNLAEGRTTTDAVTDLLRRPANAVDHETFKKIHDKVIVRNTAAAQLDRDDLLQRGYQGINERAVTMVSDVMTDLLKQEKQTTNDVAAVMETLVDDAHRTGMTANQFTEIVHRQFRAAAQNVTAAERQMLVGAQGEVRGRINDRYTELASNGLDARRTTLRKFEKEVDGRAQTARPVGRR